MKTVKVKDLVFGEGKPKICVPIVGKTIDELIDEIKLIKELEADLVEWRVDFYNDVDDIQRVKSTVEILRNELGEMPLLSTFRSKREGGNRELKENDYFKLYEALIDSHQTDLIDIELFSCEEGINKIVNKAIEKNVKIVMSNHDFNKTPEKEEIISRLKKMQDLGANLLKIAVMPNNPSDVITLLDATNTMAEKYANRPIVTMSMGSLGAISRLSGEAFGSCMTFGSAKCASAPGQIEVSELREILDLLHK